MARLRLSLSLAAVAFMLLGPGLAARPAHAQEDAETLRTLEDELKGLRREIDALKKAEQEAARTRAKPRPTADGQGLRFAEVWGYDVYTTWDGGFYLNFVDPYAKTVDDQVIHRLRPFAYGNLDYVYATDEHHAFDDTFRPRYMRLGMEGFAFRHIEYVLEAEFDDDSSTRLRRAYVDFNFFAPVRFRMGHFRTPLGLEQQVSERWQNFIERPLMYDMSRAGFDLGAVVHGDLTYANYAIGVMNGGQDNKKDSEDAKDFVFRLMLTPFKEEKGSDIEDSGLGFTFTQGHRRDAFPFFETAAGTSWLPEAEMTSQRGSYSRIGSDLLVAGGPLRLQVEYLGTHIQNVTVGGGAEQDATIHGVTADVLFMVTGEARFWDKRLDVKDDFDPIEGGSGALELGLRYEHLDVETDFARSFTRGTDELDALTLGLTWYINDHVRFMVNAQRVWFDDATGIRGSDKNEDILFFRLGFEL